MLPTSAAERELWTIWIGYLAALVVNWAIFRLLQSQEIIMHGSTVGQRERDLVLYPTMTMLSGLAFFIMGSNYWGRCYAIGAGFLLLAALMPWRLEYASLAFGVMWTVALAALGLRLRKLGQKHDEAKQHA